MNTTLFFLLELTRPGDRAGPSVISETYCKGQTRVREKGKRERQRQRACRGQNLSSMQRERDKATKTQPPGRRRRTSVNGEETSVRWLRMMSVCVGVEAV